MISSSQPSRPPLDHYESDEQLRAAIDAIGNGAFSSGDRGLFKPIVDNLLGSDPYELLADYRSWAPHLARGAGADSALEGTAP